ITVKIGHQCCVGGGNCFRLSQQNPGVSIHHHRGERLRSCSGHSGVNGVTQGTARRAAHTRRFTHRVRILRVSERGPCKAQNRQNACHHERAADSSSSLKDLAWKRRSVHLIVVLFHGGGPHR